MLTVWSVCATEKERERIGERNGGEKWLLLWSQTVSKPTLASLSRDEAHTEAEAWQTLKIYSCFPKSSSCSFRGETFFFPCLCMTTLKSFSASNFAWTSFVFTKASGSWEQRRNLFRFSYENLWRLTFGVVALHVFGGKFLRLVETVKTVERDYGIHHLSLSSLDSRSVASDEWMQLSLVYFLLVFWTSFLHSECRVIRKAVRVKCHFATPHFYFIFF